MARANPHLSHLARLSSSRSCGASNHAIKRPGAGENENITCGLALVVSRAAPQPQPLLPASSAKTSDDVLTSNVQATFGVTNEPVEQVPCPSRSASASSAALNSPPTTQCRCESNGYVQVCDSDNGNRHISCTPRLPEFSKSAEPNFQWGNLDGEDFVHATLSAYAEVVHWRRNLFLVPYGKIGKMFVKELAHLFLAFAQGSAMERIAIHAAMLAYTLLLQKPHQASKCKEHAKALERRIKARQEGDIDGLMREGRTIQHHLPLSKRMASEDKQSRVFAQLVMEGKIHSALRFFSESQGNGVLDLNGFIDDTKTRTVLDVLKEKHPPGR